MTPATKGSTPPRAGRTTARRVLVVVLTLVAAGGLVWGIKHLGDEARRRIAERDRYTVRFEDIECDSPPGLDRPTFLVEVRYASGFPQTFQSIDPELKAKLGGAFIAHPWVAAVESVAAEPEGKVRVALRFRVPVLVIHLQGGGTRFLDREGILLPRGADRAGIPEFTTVVEPQPIRAGLPWPDQTVERALHLAEAHRPSKLRKTAKGWQLTMPDGRTLEVER